jgi:hypothetical protein
MGEQSWLIRGLRGPCLIPGLPEGKGFRLDRGDEAGRFRTLPWPIISALPTASLTTIPLPVEKAWRLENTRTRAWLAAQFGLGIDGAEHDAELAHFRPREGIAEMLEQLAIAQRYARFGGGDEMDTNFSGIGARLQLLPRGCEALS